jgi:type II secretion system protein N
MNPFPSSRAARSRVGFGLGLLAALLLSFAAGLQLFFPAAALKERLEQQAAARGVELRLAGLALRFPPALAGEGVTIRPGGARGAALELSSAVVRPRWLTLFGGDPALAFRLELPGGGGSGTIRRSGALDLELSRIPFTAPLAGSSALAAAGTLERGSLSGSFPLAPTTATRLELTLAGVRLTGLKAAGLSGDALPLGTVTLRATGQGSAFSVAQLAAAGGELEATGDGSLLFARPAEHSRLNLNLTLRPGPGLAPELAALLDLLGPRGADGAWRLHLAGTLGRPEIR